MKPVDRRTFLGTLGAASAFTHRPPPGARRPRLHRAERHDPARAGGLRHAGPAAGEHGPRVADRPAVRRGGRSQSRLAGLRRLGGVRQPRSDPQVPRRPAMGRRATRASAGRDVARQIMEAYYRKQNRPATASAPTRTTARCSRRRPTSRASSTSRPITSTAASTSRRCGRARPPSRTSRSRACCTKCAARCRRRARARRRRTCWPTATTPTATRWPRGSRPGVDRHRARSAQLDRTGRSGRRACRSSTRPGHPCRRASTGRSGRVPSRIVHTIRATRSPCTAAGIAYGTGCLGDMGHYSLWQPYRILDLGVPVFVEARPSNDAVRRRAPRERRRPRVAGRASRKPAPCAGVIPRRPTARPWTRSGTTAA